MNAISSTFISRILGISNFNKVTYNSEKIGVLKRNINKYIKIQDIKKCELLEGNAYSDLYFNLNNNIYTLISGMPKNEARKLKLYLEAIIKSNSLRELEAFVKSALTSKTPLDLAYASEYKKIVIKVQAYYDKYISEARQVEKLIPNRETYWKKHEYKHFNTKLRSVFFDYKLLSISPTQTNRINIEKYLALIKDSPELRTKHNADFIKQEKEVYLDYFNNVESDPLTEMQKEAVIVNEKNNLIIAGAGSGKTSVMVAKAGYLVLKYNVKPENILLLAYNRKASIELQDRINEKLNMKMDSLTFHALGLSIIGEVDVKPTIGKWATDEKAMSDLLESIINVLLANDKDFSSQFVSYFRKSFFKYHSKFDFKTHGEYIEYIKSVELRSLKGDLVKSYEEADIANFLLMNNIEYVYEPPYEIETSTKTHGQYKPDFYLPKFKIYIEHFGINRNGDTAAFVDKVSYHEGMAWKRALHRHNGTTLVESYSYEKQEDMLTDNLRQKLSSYGVVFTPITLKSAIEIFNEQGMTNSFMRIVNTFLNNYKANEHNIDDLIRKNMKLKKFKRSNAFLELFRKILAAYELHQKSNNMIDFNDMINIALSHIKSGKYKSRYTHILVDEFQDISKSRAKLVKELTLQHEDSSLCVVGDDWQSINRFAGSDISIFHNFAKLYGDSETIHLDYTFRFNEKISKVSQGFIQNNPNQIKKTIKTIKKREKTSIFIWWDSLDVLDSINSLLQTISENRKDEKISVFVLARFWLIVPDGVATLNSHYPNIVITPLSIHASKGLEADYVIILGNESGKYGFPARDESDPIINLVLSDKEEFSYSEERRLFYVAMTRAKDEVHLFASSYRVSPFINELLQDNEKEIELLGKSIRTEPCIKCSKGSLVPRQAKASKKKFLACTNFPYCNHMTPYPYCDVCKISTMVRDSSGKSFTCSSSICSYSLPACEKCSGKMNVKVGKYGSFYGCSNFPACKNTVKIKLNLQNTQR